MTPRYFPGIIVCMGCGTLKGTHPNFTRPYAVSHGFCADCLTMRIQSLD